MTDEITLDFDKLRQHAALVTSVSDEVGKALSSVKGGDLGSEAFGIMCSFLVSPTMAMTLGASGMLGQKVSLLLRTATQLRSTAAQWEQLEQNVKTTYNTLEKAMD